jgi:SPP1 family phage portal protein
VIKGIPQIKIPIKRSELTIEAVEPYIDSIFAQFEDNAKKIRTDYDVFCLNQNILSKHRKYQDSDANNMVVIPNLRSSIEWKVGYTIGNPIKYAQTKDNQTDDIEIINKHFRSVSKNKVNEEEITWALVSGVGYTFTQPKLQTVDPTEEAPFDIFCIDADRCAKIRSAYLGEEELFDLIFTTYEEIKADGTKQTVKVLQFYFPDAMYTYEWRIGYPRWQRVGEAEPRPVYKHLPLTEKRANKDGIGIVALGQDLADTMDMLISSGLDNVEEIVNQFFIYYNVNLGQTPEEQSEKHRKAMKNKAIVLNSQNKDAPARLETLSPKLDLSQVVELYSLVNSVFHAVIGVPMEMSNTNSGGTTKQGSEVANGYDNAYTRFLKDTNYFISADYEQLKKIMWIEKNTPQNPINNITTFDIQIKYQPNQIENVLAKAQAFGTYIQFMPPAMALRLVRASSDPEAEGKEIEKSAIYKAYLESKQPQKSQEATTPTDDADKASASAPDNTNNGESL